MSDPFVAEIRPFGFAFAPRGWALCNGQLMSISQNTALFSLLGTTYGGDGRTTFALPNLQGSAPLGQGQGPGLSLYDLGETGGSSTVSLLATEVPAHTHTLQVAQSAVTKAATPSNTTWLGLATSATYYVNGATPNTALASAAVSTAGSGLPHENMQPYLTISFGIALQGVFPPRG